MIHARHGRNRGVQIGFVRPAPEIPPGAVAAAGQRMQEFVQLIAHRLLHGIGAFGRRQRDLERDIDANVERSTIRVPSSEPPRATVRLGQQRSTAADSRLGAAR